MISVFIIVGFLFYFITVGYSVHNKKNVVLLLWGFTALYGLAAAMLIFHQPNGGEKNTCPTVFILSVFILISFLIKVVWFSVQRGKIGSGAQREKDTGNEKSINSLKSIDIINYKMSGKDWLCLLGITIVCGVLVFFRLGSMSAPESSLKLDTSQAGSNEIVLDFGVDIYVSDLYLFLGHMDSRTLAVSYYDLEKDEWIVINDKSEAEAVYNWDKVQVDKTLRYLGIVSRNTEAVYNELVVLDNGGNQILPDNTADYSELFDEQELFPEDITYYYRTMFDEVYYARSAFEYLNGMNMFEYTHPPLGKILMGIGLLLFGVTPFGWRLVCALLGVLLIPVIYLFVYRLTGKTRYSLFASALVTLDFMHFTLSRIATIDSIVAFFILSMFCLMYFLLTEIQSQLKRKDYRITGSIVRYILMGSIATGAAVATKWTGFYAAAGIAVLFCVAMGIWLYQSRLDKKHSRYLCKLIVITGVCFLGITAIIYLLSYIPMSMTEHKGLFQAMIENGKFMLQFHSNIVFDHPYQSAWYTWPLDLVPLVDSANLLSKEGMVSVVATFGNPIIWWVGLIAFVYLLYKACFKKDRKAAYLTFAYIAMLAPWMIIKRTVFIYQYYTCSLLLACILGVSFVDLEKKWKNACPVVTEIALICGILFYPVISGFSINAATIATFCQWLSRWKFV